MAVKTSTNFNIIIASETPNFRNVLSSKFRMENFDVELATGGFHLLHLLEKEKPVNMIVINCDMPDMSAYEIISMIRESKAKTELPIIYIANSIPTNEIGELISNGLIDFLPHTDNFHPVISEAQKIFQQIKLIAA